MTTRSPNNPRYQKDAELEGKSRRSAASAKPKMKAAATVTTASEPTTRAEKRKARAARRAESRKDEQRMDSMGTPTDPKYKYWRRWWWVLLIAAIATTAISWIVRVQFGSDGVPLTLSYIMLGLAYAFIIAAIVVDFKMIRPIRKAWHYENTKGMSKKKLKEREKQEAEAAALLEEKKKDSVKGRFTTRMRERKAEKHEEKHEAAAVREAQNPSEKRVAKMSDIDREIAAQKQSAEQAADTAAGSDSPENR